MDTVGFCHGWLCLFRAHAVETICLEAPYENDDVEETCSFPTSQRLGAPANHFHYQGLLTTGRHIYENI